jgi:hypothetical protein
MFGQQAEHGHGPVFHPPIPIEAMAGDNSAMFQMILSRNFGEKQQFNFFHLSTFEDVYSEYAPDNFLIKNILAYNINRRINIGAGANFLSQGFRPLVAATFSHFTRNIGLIVQPSFELHKDGVGEVFLMFEWSPKNEKTIQPYFRLQALSTFNSAHVYSYHFWRAGVQYKNLRVGPAFNVQYAGPEATTYTNVGGFINFLIQ